MAVHGGVGGVGPVFDIGAAGEEESPDGLADDADGAFGDAVELVDIGRRKIALDSRVITQFEEAGGDEFTTVVGVNALDGEFWRACRALSIGKAAEIGEQTFDLFRGFGLGSEWVHPDIT